MVKCILAREALKSQSLLYLIGLPVSDPDINAVDIRKRKGSLKGSKYMRYERDMKER